MSGNSSRQEILAIVNQLCSVGTAESVQPSTALEAALAADSGSQPSTKELLQRLYIYLMEAIDEATEARESMQQWKSLLTQITLRYLTQKVTKGLLIPRTDYAGINAEMSSRLNILIQLACYIRFLKSQENDAAYGDQRPKIKDTLFKITQMGRVLRQLLSSISDEDIGNFINQGISDQVLILDKCIPAAKRAVCCVAVEVILDTLTNIHVSVSSNSVIIG